MVFNNAESDQQYMSILINWDRYMLSRLSFTIIFIEGLQIDYINYISLFGSVMYYTLKNVMKSSAKN